jgi:MraZ protein
MESANQLLIGEWLRTLDDRRRLSLPVEWAGAITDAEGQCVLAKELPGCLSVWNPADWRRWLDQGVELLASKLRSGRLTRQAEQVQRLGRLLSTRHRLVPVAGRGRIALPDNFGSFLEVEPNGEVLVVGAAVCLEIWRPDAWRRHIGEQMPRFRELFDQLTE